MRPVYEQYYIIELNIFVNQLRMSLRIYLQAGVLANLKILNIKKCLGCLGLYNDSFGLNVPNEHIWSMVSYIIRRKHQLYIYIYINLTTSMNIISECELLNCICKSFIENWLHLYLYLLVYLFSLVLKVTVVTARVTFKYLICEILNIYNIW